MGSTAEYGSINTINMTLILLEIGGLQKIAFFVNGHQRLNNGIYCLVEAHFIHK